MNSEKAKRAIKKILGESRVDNLVLNIKEPLEIRRGEKWSRSPQGVKSRSTLEEIRNSQEGKRCFVIGNGPSLNMMDLSKMKDEVTIGSNGLFLLFDEMGFVPSYYTIEDALVAEDRQAEAMAIPRSHKIYPYDIADYLKDSAATYVNFRRTYRGFPKFSKNLVEEGFWTGTVTMFNLQLAFHLGCSEVYIIGCDHNYFIKDDVQKDGFEFTSTSNDVNHFHPDYFGKGYRWHDPNVDRMEQGYLLAKEVFQEDDRTVFNATIGGKLDVFDRIDYDTLF